MMHLEKEHLPSRLKVLFDGVRAVVGRYRPDAASIEIVLVNVNPQSTFLLGQARGAAATALVFSDLTVVGYGRAEKTQVQEMVRRLLTLPGPDAADALGLAITQAHAAKAMARLAQADGVLGAGSGQYKAGRSR